MQNSPSLRGLSRREFLRMTAVGSAGALLIACTPATPSETTQSGEGDEAPVGGVSGTVSWYAAQSPPLIELYEEMWSTFQEEHGDTELEEIYVPWSEFGTKLQTLVAAGEAPDMAWLLLGQGGVGMDAQRWAADDLLLNLNALTDEMEVDDAYPGVIDAASFEGNLIGVPFEFNNLFLWYNKDIFDEAGMEYPSADETWESVVEKGEQLTVRDGDRIAQYGYKFGQSGWDWFIYQWQAGQALFNEENSAVDIDNEAGRDAWQRIYNTQVERGITPLAAESGFENLASGAIAMEVHGNFQWDTYAPAVRVGSTLMPQGPGPEAWNRSTFQRQNVWSVTKDAPNPETAMALAMHCGYGRGLEVWAGSGRFAPYRRFDSDFYLQAKAVAGTDQEEAFLELLDNFFQMTEWGRTFPTPANEGATFDEINGIASDIQFQMVEEQSITPDEAAALAHQQINDYLASV